MVICAGVIVNVLSDKDIGNRNSWIIMEIRCGQFIQEDRSLYQSRGAAGLSSHGREPMGERPGGRVVRSEGPTLGRMSILNASVHSNT